MSMDEYRVVGQCFEIEVLTVVGIGNGLAGTQDTAVQGRPGGALAELREDSIVRYGLAYHRALPGGRDGRERETETWYSVYDTCHGL